MKALVVKQFGALAVEERPAPVPGTGEVLEPDDQIASVGSGSGFALAAARGLLRNTEMSAEAIVRGSLEIAGEICIYTNQNLTIETL